MAAPSFRFKHFDLKGQRAGTAVEITLNAINNVRLMTAGNFQRFKELLDFKYVGGVAKKSPIRLVIPEDGHWHLVVDMEGHRGLADCSVKVTPPAAAAQRKAG
ncbi:hypothetical protein REJC140_02963 [Pseudorhizobium endolithicum]|uniref:DUF1883 domain-containing protein n=1 Tax=Pseudorhizobium endolithicum TaxID=1191678 RepID=A0ABN7JII5_9HYPH|nr:DUF1883 domain-containing protein [Pseudorhizobium endolithicum]CAD7031777.1 hypothetical protein REJC140_02963 [Pseudorhizobium endolithicum]